MQVMPFYIAAEVRDAPDVIGNVRLTRVVRNQRSNGKVGMPGLDRLQNRDEIAVGANDERFVELAVDGVGNEGYS